MRRRSDRELAAEKYPGRESATARAARLRAYREQRAVDKARRKQRRR